MWVDVAKETQNFMCRTFEYCLHFIRFLCPFALPKQVFEGLAVRRVPFDLIQSEEKMW